MTQNKEQSSTNHLKKEKKKKSFITQKFYLLILLLIDFESLGELYKKDIKALLIKKVIIKQTLYYSTKH